MTIPTSVDIDKLKERYNVWLLAQSGDDDAIAAEIMTDLPALIAKAERVDEMEADFRALDQAVSNSIRETDEPHRVLWKGQWYDGPAAEIANSILRVVQKLARNALSPKESE